EPGHLVRVGLGQRAVAGVVISLNGAVIARELRPVDALVHPLPLLRPHQLALARWIAERYRCGLADAVRAMLPPALASRARSTKLGTARGERTETVFAIAPAGKEAMTGGVRLGARQLVTLRALAAGAVTGHDLADAGGSAVAARALARRGLAIEGTRAVRRIPAEFALAGEDPSRDAVATSAQAAALAAIIAALGSGRGRRGDRLAIGALRAARADRSGRRGRGAGAVVQAGERPAVPRGRRGARARAHLGLRRRPGKRHSARDHVPRRAQR